MLRPKLSCPLCGEPAVTVWEKMWLAPVWHIHCRSCHRLVGDSLLWRILAAAPLLLGLFLAANHGPLAVGIAIALGVVAMSFSHLYWAPLAPRLSSPVAQFRKENDVDWCQQFFASGFGVAFLALGLAEGAYLAIGLGLALLVIGVVHALRWRKKKQTFERVGPTGTDVA